MMNVFFLKTIRVAGVLFAGFASLGWIADRLFGLHNSMDVVVSTVAHRGAWIAAVLFFTSLACWLPRKDRAAGPLEAYLP
ncbi:MAG TPA: hypothetical protein VKH15_17055 [Candidatus Acidoferrum sp.]|nr:hypothetical protein [Candidatus Acidoferrum sp.]